MRKKYIPCDEHWFEFFDKNEFYKTHRKFPISKINKKPLWNKIDMNEVAYMLANFYQEAWMPITVDKNFNLVDGQHRLEFASQMHLKYIDIAVFDEYLQKNPTKKYNNNELDIPGWPKLPKMRKPSLKQVLANL